MSVKVVTRRAGGANHQVYTLTHDGSGASCEVWPSLGCNCLRWRVPGPTGLVDLLYVADDWESNPVTTRSGIPVLFPFPNRIRDGRFTWDGQEYQLPLNDHDKKNAIHGFVHNRPWWVKPGSAHGVPSLTAVFQLSTDAPDLAPYWPADFEISLTVTLLPDQLMIGATITCSHGSAPLPWGLGYHPYFALPTDYPARTQVAAGSVWELDDHLPTGAIRDADPARDLSEPRLVSELNLDDVYACANVGSNPMGFGRTMGCLQRGPDQSIEVVGFSQMRELVAFTPPHRRALCLEPYTCVTDAVNLQQRGIDTGWRVLQPGRDEQVGVVFKWVDNSRVKED